MEKRITDIMEYYGLSSAQFADKIGVQRSSISHILSGRNKPSYDFLQKISAAFPNIDANWLLNGIGTIEKRVEKKITSVIEQDLFSQKQIQQESPKIPVSATEIKTSNIPPVKDQDMVKTNMANDVENSKFTNVNSIKQIIFVYENNTFEIINQK